MLPALSFVPTPLRCVSRSYSIIVSTLTSFSNYSAPGRPPIVVDFEDIELLRRFNFTWCQIAEILGVSRSTLYRRIEEEGMSGDLSFTNISDAELDHRVEAIKRQHPNDGERLMIGHLRSHNVFVPRSRLRASIHRVDPVNTALRRRITVRRRVYNAEGPNSVWHIDGHHKLVRWQFITHGGIDGFSRTVVFLRCTITNLLYGAACPSSLSSLTMGEIELLVSQIPDSIFFSSSRPSLASHNSIYTASLLKRFAEECMCFSSANPSLVERG